MPKPHPNPYRTDLNRNYLRCVRFFYPPKTKSDYRNTTTLFSLHFRFAIGSDSKSTSWKIDSDVFSEKPDLVEKLGCTWLHQKKQQLQTLRVPEFRFRYNRSTYKRLLLLRLQDT